MNKLINEISNMNKLINEISNMRKLMGITEGLVPSVLYHGGGADFNQFDLSQVKSGSGLITHGYGVYLTADKSVAERYALNAIGRKGYIYIPSELLILRRY